MKRLMFIFLSVLVCMVCVPALSSAAQTFDVSTEDFFFSPADLTINAGDTVRWTNPTGTPHTTTSGAGCAHNTTGVVWDSGTLSNGGTFSFTFDQPGTYPYFCSIHCISFGMKGTITVKAVASAMPPPTMPQGFTNLTIASPVLSIDPAQAQPIGVGDIATGGPNLTINVAMDQFEAPVDVYFLLFIPSIDPVNIYQLTSTGLLQPISVGLAPWKPATTDSFSENLFGSIPVSGLPSGMYFLGVLVTPAGDQSLTKYYLWVTGFTVGQ
jgi:plastocyanin